MAFWKISLVSAALSLAISSPTTADSLKDIYELALKNDPVLRSAKATYLAGSEDEKIARANLLPQLSASANFSTSDSDFDNQQVFILGGQQVPSSSVGSSDADTTSWDITLGQTLFDLPAWYRFQSSKALTEVEKARFAAAQQDLIVRVNTAYFDVLRAYDNLETRQAEERALKRQLEQTRERFEVGLLPITDVHESQAAYDDAVVNQLEAQGNLNISFEQLEVLTGQNHLSLAGLSDNFNASAPQPANSQEWVDFSLLNNFNLKVAEQAKQASGKSAAAAKAERLPSVRGTVSYNDTEQDGTRLDLPFQNNSDGYSIGVRVEVPIWLGGGLDAQRRKSAQQFVASSEDYLAAKRNTVQSARSLFTAAVTNAARVEARKQAITSANSALEATQAGYDVGTRNIVDVLQAQRSLYQARRNYANSRYDYILSMLRLKQVAGQLSPEDVYQLNAWLEPAKAVSQ